MDCLKEADMLEGEELKSYLRKLYLELIAGREQLLAQLQHEYGRRLARLAADKPSLTIRIKRIYGERIGKLYHYAYDRSLHDEYARFPWLS